METNPTSALPRAAMGNGKCLGSVSFLSCPLYETKKMTTRIYVNLKSITNFIM